MIEELFFAVGLLNAVSLIAIFTIRGVQGGIALLRRVGPFYLLLAVPAAVGIYLVVQENAAWEYGFFLGTFVVFLALEGLYEFIWKIPFRENWKALVPYLALYFVMNYGFVAMAWKTSLPEGLLLGILFAVQLFVNGLTHAPVRRKQPTKPGTA